WNNDNPSSDFTLANLNAGEFVFSVTDAQGCSSNGTATIGGPVSPLMVNISGNSIVCGEDLGFISTTVTGNEGTISYQWSKEGIGVLNDTTANIANATVGLYTIVVVSEGCTASDQYFLGNNLPLLNVQSGNVTCFDGDDGYASATPSGGEPPYTYQWYSLNGSPSITNPTDSLQNNLAAGTYTLTVSEASGCISSNEFTITQPSLLQILSNIENADCSNNFEGHIEISITGGVAPYNILWENGSTSYTLSNLLVDDYALFISDYNGCSLQESVTVAQSGEPLEVNFTTVAPTCGNANGAILSEIASSNNAVSYTWNGTVGDSNYINITAGTYTVEYTDVLCKGSTTITRASPGGPQIDSSMVIP
ncbi:MAG: SprB repeat-containing protein, partial [Flavobacteriales bacterium]